MEPETGVRTVALVSSSAASYTLEVAGVAQRSVDPSAGAGARAAAQGEPGSRPVAAVMEGTLTGEGSRPFRAAVVGDADFASNSFFPYMANSDLALSLVRWLVREERAAPIASRIPVPSLILLTDAQARGIFLVLEVLLPVTVMGVGLLSWWRHR
jgi:ABC-type uncharacterized transport system involved in gliding motility auxiliary subunit